LLPLPLGLKIRIPEANIQSCNRLRYLWQMKTLRFCKGFQKHKQRRQASLWRGRPGIVAASGIIAGDVDSKS
jgi:hypothetical protein